MINIVTTSRYKVEKKHLVSMIQAFLDKHQAGHFDVNVVFIGKRKMRSIASEYGHGDVAKPVLSFPYKDSVSDETGTPMLGEVFVCYPQAVLLAAERDKSVDATIDQLVEHGLHNLFLN